MVSTKSNLSCFFCEGEAARLFRRTEDSVTQDELLRAKPKNKIYPVLDSLNALAATPWKINEPVGPVKIKINMLQRQCTTD